MLLVLFSIITPIWLGLFIAWIVYAIKACKEEKLCSFSEEAIKYNKMMSKLAVGVCLTAMVLNILNILIHLQ